MLASNHVSMVGSGSGSGSSGGREDTSFETMGAQLHEVCKHQPESLNKIQGILAKCPNAAMHRDGDGRTALHILCAHRPPLQSVAFLAANPMSCLQQTTKGMLPLHYACRNQASREVVEFLLGQCPETVRMANTSGWLSLHLACARGASPEVIETLVNAWPDSVRQTTNDGRMALHFACANHAPLEVIQLLVLHCREALAIQDQNEWAPLHIASAYSENIDVVTFLAIECPEILQSRGNLGRLPIHVACWEGQALSIVEFLVQACPTTLLTRDHNNLLPLHCACLGSSSQPVIEYLIEQFPDSVLEIGLTVQEVARHVSRESGLTAPPLELCQWLHRIQPALIYDGPEDQTAPKKESLPDTPRTTTTTSPSPTTENASTPRTSINDETPVAPEGSNSRTETRTRADEAAAPPQQNEERNPITARRPRRANKAQGQQQPQQQEQQQQQQQQQQPPPPPKKLPPDVVLAGQQLHKACEAPQSLGEIMQILAETPPAIEITTYGNALPIHTAALNQASSEILKFLFRLLPTSLMQPDSEGNLPLHLACYSGASVESIKALVKECPESLQWKNLQGQTPLDKAKQPFLENPDDQVISFLEKEMPSNATSPIGKDPPPQTTNRTPVAAPSITSAPSAGTTPNQPPPPLSQPAPPSFSSTTTDASVNALGQKINSLLVNNAETKPNVPRPLEIPLGNPPPSLMQGRRPPPVTRSFTTPTGWARNVPSHGPPANPRPAPPSFQGQGNFMHPSLAQPPPQMNIDPYFRDCPPPRVPASPNASPLRGGGRPTLTVNAPGTPSSKNRAPSPSAAQRRLPSPAIIFGGRSNRSRSRSPSPSPMVRGIAGFFRRKGGNNSRNSSPARDNSESIPTADVVLVTGNQLERDLVNNPNNNNSSNYSNDTAPKRIMGLPDAPFANEITLPTLQRNANPMEGNNNLAAPNRPASMQGPTSGCFSPDELARLRGQDFQPMMNVNDPYLPRVGGPMNNAPPDATIPKPAAKKPINNSNNNNNNNTNTTPRVFQRPMVVEAGTLTERAFRPGAVAVNEPVLRPDSALYRAVNTPRAPSPVTTSSNVPQPYRPGFSEFAPVTATSSRPHGGDNGGGGDEPDIVVMPLPMDDYQIALERSRQMEMNISPHPTANTSGMQRDSMMEIIRMQEMALMEGLRASNTTSSNNMPAYSSNPPAAMMDNGRTARQEDGRGTLGVSSASTSSQVEVVDRRLATIEAANIGSFYRSAIASGDVAPIDLIPVTPEEDEEATIMPLPEHAFGPPPPPPRSPPGSFVEYAMDGSSSATTPPGAAGRVNRWAVMTGSPAGKPVSSFYRDAMRTAEEHPTTTSSNFQRADHRLATPEDVSNQTGMGSRTMVSSFYRAAILEAAADQGGNHDGFLAGIEE